MMLLGIVLHGIASYTTLPLGDAWPFRDAHTSDLLNLPLFVIHLFRMPAFFALAGFFAAMLLERGGLRLLVANRAKRVLFPLIVFWAALTPLVAAGFVFAIHMGTGVPVAEIVSANATRVEVNTMHLWFLYYLVIFYAAAAVTVWLTQGRGLPAGVCAALTTSWWAPLLWLAATVGTLLTMPFPTLEAATTLTPPLRSLAGHGVFFLFGWLLFRGRARLDILPRRAWRSSVLAFIAIVLFIALELAPPFDDARSMHVVRSIVTATGTWALVLAVIGLSLRYVTRERPAVTYLSRAAYWVYLVHLPVVITVAGALAPATLHAFVKVAVVVGVTTAVSLVTYHVFVRDTRLGTFLNGRRVSPASPSPAEVSL